MCPFVDNADARCAAHLTFRNLVSAFAHCADQYTRCKTYQELLRGFTANGRNHQSTDTLKLLVAS